jgi:CheY-like chemotaxis protein
MSIQAGCQLLRLRTGVLEQALHGGRASRPGALRVGTLVALGTRAPRDARATERAIEEVRMDHEKTRGHLLLVVDDEPLIRWFLANALSSAGYDVVVSETAADAVARFGAGDRVTLVVLDLKLPDSDGLSVLREIKARRPSCPVILMTAHGTEETRHQAVEAGAFEMIGKPFGTADILALIRRAIS